MEQRWPYRVVSYRDQERVPVTLTVLERGQGVEPIWWESRGSQLINRSKRGRKDCGLEEFPVWKMATSGLCYKPLMAVCMDLPSIIT